MILNLIFLGVLLAVGALFLRGVQGGRPIRPILVAAILSILLFTGYRLYTGNFLLPEPTSDDVGAKVFYVLAIILLVNCLIEWVKWGISYAVLRRQMRLPHFLLDILGWLVLLTVTALIVSHYVTADLTGVVVSSTVVSAIIALSLQQLLSSFFAGIALQIESPFLPNDWVEVDGQEGRVVRMNWRTLSIITRRNALVTLPNSIVAQQRIINFSRPQMLQAIDLFIGVAYRHPPTAVKTLLREAAVAADGVLAIPAPHVILWEYGDSGIVYRVRISINDYSRKNMIYDDVMTRFWYVLRRANFEIPFPQRDLHLVQAGSDEADHAQRLAQEVGAIELFATLSAEQHHAIVTTAQTATFTKGERLVKQGDTGDSLFVVLHGEVTISIRDEHGHQIDINRRTAGDFFGEMSLLTGEPRSATVTAAAETDVLILDKAALRTLTEADPSVLEKLVAAVERRQANRDSKLAEHLAANEMQPITNRAFMRRIYQFLGLPAK